MLPLRLLPVVVRDAGGRPVHGDAFGRDSRAFTRLADGDDQLGLVFVEQAGQQVSCAHDRGNEHAHQSHVAETRVPGAELGDYQRNQHNQRPVGDSHAAQWLPALREVAKQNDWRILTMLKGSCSFSTATRRRDEGLDSVSSCVTWNKVAQKKLQATPVISEVFVSADLKDLFSAGDGTSRFENAVSGYLSAWKTIPKSVQNIEVLQDTPRPDRGAVTCLQLLNRTQRLKPGVCSRSGAAAISPDPLAKAATQDARATLIDLDDYFCSATRCNPVIGHVVVYRDQSHITATYARTLAPYLADALKGARRHPG